MAWVKKNRKEQTGLFPAYNERNQIDRELIAMAGWVLDLVLALLVPSPYLDPLVREESEEIFHTAHHPHGCCHRSLSQDMRPSHMPNMNNPTVPPLRTR